MLGNDPFDRGERRARGMPLTRPATPPVVRWAWVGSAIMMFVVYVLGRWIVTGRAVPTAPGPDPLPHSAHLFIVWVQWIAMLLGAVVFSLIVVRPWIRRAG